MRLKQCKHTGSSIDDWEVCYLSTGESQAFDRVQLSSPPPNLHATRCLHKIPTTPSVASPSATTTATTAATTATPTAVAVVVTAVTLSHLEIPVRSVNQIYILSPKLRRLVREGQGKSLQRCWLDVVDMHSLWKHHKTHIQTNVFDMRMVGLSQGQ